MTSNEITTESFSRNDVLLFNKSTKNWFRFVAFETDYLVLFTGKGDTIKQEWKRVTVINKPDAKSIWKEAVENGYIKMTVE